MIPRHSLACCRRALAAFALVCSLSRSPAAEPLPASAVADQFFYTVSQSREGTIWVAPPTWKVERDTAAPAALRNQVDLHAARNEFEPVQIVTSAAFAGTRRLSLGSTWTGPSGEVLRSQLHDLLYEGAGECPQGLPNALNPIPFGTDLAVCASMNQVFWLTFYVPTNAAAGTYTNSITVDLPGLSASFPIHLQVFDFSLPAELGFRSLITWPFSGNPTNAFQTKRWFYEHRLTPESVTWPSALVPMITWNDCGTFDDEGLLSPDYSIRWLAHTFVAGQGFNDGYGFPAFLAQRFVSGAEPRPSTFCGQNLTGDPRGPAYGTDAYNPAWGTYLKALQDYCDPLVAPANGGNPFGHDYLAKALYLLMNEPQSTADYDLAAWLASISRQYAPKLPLMISEEAKPEIFNNPQYPNAGFDVWLAYTPAYSTAMRHALDRTTGHHEQTWWYEIPALPLHFANPAQLARPAIETRVLTWLAWKHRVEGWSSPGLESPLLSVFNSTTNTLVVPTQRSELLREAFEDYEYFKLANHGRKALPDAENLADAFVDPIARSLTAFERDPSLLHWERLQLGRLLSNEPHETQWPANPQGPGKSYGSYAFNFQDPAGVPTSDPLVVNGRLWTKVGWPRYNLSQQFGWLLPDASSGRYLFGAATASGGVTELEGSYVYDDYAGLCTFVLGLENGVYDVAITAGRPTHTSQALVTVNGLDFFGDRLANQPEALNGNSTRTRRLAIRGGALYLDIGQAIGGDYWFLDSLALTGVSPSSADGLDDLWQTEYFGSATNVFAAPTADPDGDGADNRHEFYFGTNPNSAASRPSTTVERSGPNAILLQWSSRPGQTYQIEASADLQAWTLVLDGQSTTASTASATLDLPAGLAARFLRVGAVAP